MENFTVKNLSFCYPTRVENALSDVTFTINQGEFVLICGRSGCGKTTLLRLLKPALAPAGSLSGSILWNGKNIADCDPKEHASKIGFVMQNPDSQIVTDKVWHELSFGLESLGYQQAEIRTRVSEMASFFGIEAWFHKKVAELSGGQKQLLNLASIMALEPSALILDEPTAQLDPIAAGEFFKTLEKINRELGITIILTEHRTEEAFTLADKVIVMDEGKIVAESTPEKIAAIIKAQIPEMYSALPTPIRIHDGVKSTLPCPITVRDGRQWLETYAKEHALHPDIIPHEEPKNSTDIAIEAKNVWFRYEKNSPDVVKDFSLKVKKGTLYCLLGGNGIGKTTALSLISGLHAPYRGEVLINGQSISGIKNLYRGVLGVLPQDPQSVFVKKTVFLDLLEMLSEKNLTKEEKEQTILNISTLCRIETLLQCHPYDLSGGEQQRAALAKVLLTEPEILILDEPTKGMDTMFKEEFAEILSALKEEGVTVLMVSHDVEFCAKYADTCALMFDGSITSANTPREFFKNNHFYTTAANRMARTLLPDAVLAEDVIASCLGDAKPEEKKTYKTSLHTHKKDDKPKENKTKKAPIKVVIGVIFALLFVIILLAFYTDINLLELGRIGLFGIGFLQIISAAIALFCLLPQKTSDIEVKPVERENRKLTKRTLWSTLLILLLIPLTIYVGVVFFGNRKYYFISLLIILETLLPFCLMFESRKPKARELVIISVLCAIATIGRSAFFMFPSFKPVVAILIVTGICFGGETGFLAGAITGFVSNFFFGHGPWTPWQMFAFGIIGFVAGILFKKGFLRKTKLSLCIFGFLSTLILYGGIMNPASIIMWQSKINLSMIASACLAGLPFDLAHAAGTAFFLWCISEPMIQILERVKVKYGI